MICKEFVEKLEKSRINKAISRLMRQEDFRINFL